MVCAMYFYKAKRTKTREPLRELAHSAVESSSGTFTLTWSPGLALKYVTLASRKHGIPSVRPLPVVAVFKLAYDDLFAGNRTDLFV